MYLITIIPLSHNPQTDELSYFSKKPYEIGAFVIAPLGKQKVSGIVTGTTALLSEKQTIKEAPFEMRKLPEQEPNFKIPFIDIYQNIADYHVVHLNYIFRHAIPYEYLSKENTTKLPLPKKTRIEVIQANTTERIIQYKALIRSAFSNQQSVIVLVPTVQEIDFWYEAIKKGIESISVKITSEQSNRTREESLKFINTNKHPIVVVTTPYYFPSLLYKKHIVIVEHESSPYYRDHISKLHMDKIVLALSEVSSDRSIRGDTLLSTETLYLLNNGTYDSYVPLQWPQKEIKTVVVARPKDRDYAIFSEALNSLLEVVTKEKSKVVLYGVRNGLATFTKCQTCQATLCCDTCVTPLVLVTRPEGRVFRCSKCHTTYEATKPCQQCGSRFLLPFGAGTETIETEVKTKFPELETFRIDSEVTKTKKQAKKILQQFEKSQQACLIVGEKGLHLIREPVSYSAIVSCDSLFELPLLDAERKVFEILLSMESITKKEMLVQVFDTEQPVIEAYQTSTIKKWSESHIQERMHFKYPPLYIHIKYTVSLPYEIQIQQIEHNWKKISAINVQTNIMYHKSKAQYVFIGSAFVERELWNNPSTKRQELLNSLHSFPKTGIYEINPDSLL